MIIDKILNYITLNKIPKSTFEKKSGLSNGYLANIKKSNSEVQPKMVERILNAYPELESVLESAGVSKEYSPFKNEANATIIGEEVGVYKRNGNEFKELSSGLYKLKTKLVMQKAQAGYLTGWGDDEYLEDLPEHEIVVSKPVAGQYMSFEANGDSMDDGSKESIENGSIITGRKIERRLWTSKLHLNKFKDFVVVCHNRENNEGGILIKRIIKHNTIDNYIICHSLNPDKSCYPDFKIEMIDIMQIFNVVQVTRKY